MSKVCVHSSEHSWDQTGEKLIFFWRGTAKNIYKYEVEYDAGDRESSTSYYAVVVSVVWSASGWWWTILSFPDAGDYVDETEKKRWKSQSELTDGKGKEGAPTCCFTALRHELIHYIRDKK